jgi:hypothetical protein
MVKYVTDVGGLHFGLNFNPTPTEFQLIDSTPEGRQHSAKEGVRSGTGSRDTPVMFICAVNPDPTDLLQLSSCVTQLVAAAIFNAIYSVISVGDHRGNAPRNGLRVYFQPCMRYSATTAHPVQSWLQVPPPTSLSCR